MPNAVWYDLIVTTQEVIQGLGLTYGGTPLPSTQVYARKLATDRNATLPFVVVALGGPEDVNQRGTFEDHEWVYPVLVVHAREGDQELSLANDPLAWRERIVEAFSDLPRPEITIPNVEVFDCQITTNPPLDLTLFQSNLDVGGILLRFRCLKTRGRN